MKPVTAIRVPQLVPGLRLVGGRKVASRYNAGRLA
jgi:hypothetical protein